MGLRHITAIVILIIQLYGASVEAADLPTLPGNKLLVGKDRVPPNAHPIECGPAKDKKGKVKGSKSSKTPTQLLTPSNFGQYAISSAAVGAPGSAQPKQIDKFKFGDVKGGKKPFYALYIDPSGESAYWLTQGGYIDIPHKPTANQPHYVFTPDFSGCAWTVTPMSNGNLRLRHGEGGKECAQFNDLTTAQKGGTKTYAMQYKDYGFVNHKGKVIEHYTAFAYMHFSAGHWMLYLQHKTCAPHAGGFTFKKNLLTGMSLRETSKSEYPNVSGTAVYTIPCC